jgi:putative ABC transport system substrate-binding protein
VIILAGFVSTGFAAQIGVILCSDTPYYKSIHKTFASELSANGIKADIIVQTPAPETGAWMNAARKFTAIGTDLIVTYGSPVTQAVLDENSAIPVVFAGVYDSQGLSVKGRKITGINSKVSTLGVLYNSAEKETVGEANEVERLGGQLSFKTVKVNVRSRDSIARIRDVDALLVTTSCAAMLYIDDIVSVARKQNIPTAALMAGGEDRGIILTLAADCTEQGKEAADRVASILRGENPSAMAVANPRKIQMTINLKEATSLGLKIPFDLLSAATRVIK